MANNVLFIMLDQLRHDWLGYRGADHVRTPNIDRIAALGMSFNQCITNSPVCAPARISLATGMRPHQLGALDNYAFLPMSRPTYYQRLRDRGYHVGCVGKLDLGKPDGYNGARGERPMTYSWGFTHPVECEGKIHAGRGNPPNGPYTAWLKEKSEQMHQAFTDDYADRAGKGAAARLHDSVVPFGLCEDDYIGDRAVELLQSFQSCDDFPWHLFVSFVGPHNPFDPAPEFAEKWRDAPMPEAIPFTPEGKPGCYVQKTNSDGTAPEQILEARRQYTAYLEQIDHHVGRLLDTLEAAGELESTTIVFSADHGEMLGDHQRYTKSCPYEAAVRVPLIVAGPGLKRGESEALVELMDVAATICDVANTGEIPDADARSLLPLLKGEREEHRELGFSTHRGFAVFRDRQFKVVLRDNDIAELYDLEQDPDELQNLSSVKPEVVASYKSKMKDYWAGEGILR